MDNWHFQGAQYNHLKVIKIIFLMFVIRHGIRMVGSAK